MSKSKYKFEDFLVSVNDDYKGFALAVDELLQKDYTRRIQSTKNGLSVSYSQPKNKWRLLGLSIREGFLVIHINTENHAEYADLLHDAPQGIIDHLSQAHDCKKLLDPPKKCWDTCEPGYSLTIKGNNYKKCRYSCFKLNVFAEDTPFLLSVIENEAQARVKYT